ncbi:tyrosine-type recombinase/integrase [Rugamonas sp. FT107W]|uniref:Tyrosine-type recombinase/integrase n=1 Tax=Duganella vulcania TaxID=2692166 RepID=A0A845HDQ4_9BURK|nr:site-specific integrase [Duganella vulcania]MYN16778.1 tyrosine-type recombinase/integrase [Duganella vulcania]
MSKVEHYVDAGTRENTRISYQSAIRHFEVDWGGFLPATADGIARYLADYAGELAVSTLTQRLAALAQWHIEQGFPDPTKVPLVKRVLKGIRTEHPARERRAKPLQLDRLEQADRWLSKAASEAALNSDRGGQLRHTRDRALLLIGFWRGFRGDELSRLQVQFVEIVPGEGMTCFFPRTKGDRNLSGTTFKAPALKKLCPVTAYLDWVNLAHLQNGPAFRSIDRWGHMASHGLHPNSMIPLLRTIFAAAGIEDADDYSAHSLRRGFANWAASSGWDTKSLMEYVGWKSVQSAMRYIDGTDPFGRQRIDSSLG